MTHQNVRPFLRLKGRKKPRLFQNFPENGSLFLRTAKTGTEAASQRHTIEKDLSYRRKKPHQRNHWKNHRNPINCPVLTLDLTHRMTHGFVRLFSAGMSVLTRITTDFPKDSFEQFFPAFPVSQYECQKRECNLSLRAIAALRLSIYSVTHKIVAQ
jgi:hypothetical protein